MRNLQRAPGVPARCARRLAALDVRSGPPRTTGQRPVPPGGRAARAVLLREALLLQPEGGVACPRVHLRGIAILRAEADAVLAVAVDVQVERDRLFAQRGGEGERVFCGHLVVLARLPNETRRRVAAHVEPRRKEALLRVGRIRAEEAFFALRIRLVEKDEAVAEDREVGPRARALDRLAGVRFAGVELRHAHRREMPAGA